jgi:hypothetical protein
VLALHPGEPVSRDRLAALLWPESDQQAARGSLRMALLALRRVLDPVDPDLIRATNESIMLDVARSCSGDRSAVLRQYEQCRKALKEDFGLGPSAETMALRDEAIGAEAEEPPGSAARTGISASDEAASFDQPPSRRTRPGWRGRLLTAVALVTLVLVVRAFWPCGLMSKCPDDATLAVIVLSPLEFDETDRRVAAVAGEITKIFANTLSRIPGARVFTPDAN